MRLTNATVAIDTVTDDPGLQERNRLVMENVGLVKALATRMARRVPSQVEVNELVSVGLIGLIEAAGRYRPSTGVPFDAFARRRVHGAMLDSLRDLDWAPRSVRRMRRDVDAAINRLRHELGREPAEAEIAGALQVSAADYTRMLDQIKTVDIGTIRQLDASRGESPLLDVAIDPEEDAHARVERAEMKQHLAAAIEELPERERQILSLYYHEELTLAEIGEVIGVGESRVSQLRTQAVSRLRARLRTTLHLAEMR